MYYVIDHETRLEFATPVREHHCEVRLLPADDSTQRVQVAHIEVDPAVQLGSYVDYFGNRVHYFSVTAPHTVLVTRLHAEVETKLSNPFDYLVVPPAREREWIAEACRAQPRLWDYVLHRSPATPELTQLTAFDEPWPSYDPRRPLLESVQSATNWVAATLTYQAGVTSVHAALADVLAAGAGVCQDFAHLLIAVVRSWGFLARYVMGYQDPSYLEPDEDDDEVTEQIEQTPHAWAEVLIPGAGWRGFDATTQLITNDTYIAVAVGRDSLDAAPQRGSFKGEDEYGPPQVSLHVQRQQESTQQ